MSYHHFVYHAINVILFLYLQASCTYTQNILYCYTFLNLCFLYTLSKV
ncbi:Hypothetical protein EUBREC_0314 [Agathobacter rectalis ATCC 33656]|uniref:Uncharacterized protein n=1 Tax=Agathobacter rectalis (strain ATCC 33656 / DSM 3377 / JCM 17463 / KCTC 5835 / VPI 0990) TaxID=515619 RepID=C4ZB42_AGARV|nr:Hypothetical protein EUBREC_0314 [Agathobacter rectalis ATCC 33656]